MDSVQIPTDFATLFASFKNITLAFLPRLLAVIALILIGLVVARLLRALAKKLITKLGRYIPIKGMRKRLLPERLETIASVLGNAIFWIVIFFFLTMATESLGLPVATTWLGGFAGYLPKILVAILIGASGLIGGRLVYDIIDAAARSAGAPNGHLLAKFAQYAILVVSILIAIDHLGVDISLLTSLIIVLLGAALFGAGLAFGLGAKTSASNILASYYLQKLYKVGNVIRIGNAEGKIIQITPTAVILQSSEGQIYLPAKQFNEQGSTLVTRKGQKDE